MAEADTKTRTQGISRPLARLSARRETMNFTGRSGRSSRSAWLPANGSTTWSAARRSLSRTSRSSKDSSATMQEGVVVVDSRVAPAVRERRRPRGIRRRQPRGSGRYAWESIRNSALQEIVDTVRQQKIPVRREIEIPRRRRIVAILGGAASGRVGRRSPGGRSRRRPELRKLETMRREFVSNVSTSSRLL